MARGRYRLIDLRPGTYTVKFTLQGFGTRVREGITLESDFTATVNMDMAVGLVEETVTVSGAAPLVDIHSTEQRTGTDQGAARVSPGRSNRVYEHGACHRDGS